MTNQERGELDGLTVGERIELSRELRAATEAGKPLFLRHGSSRLVLDAGWRSAPHRR